MLKKLCQCMGLASLILVLNYGDLLGGGWDVRMHVPFGLTGICLAQIADILLLGLFLFVIVGAFYRTRYYPRVRLLLVMVAPPYLLMRTRTELPFHPGDGLILVLGLVWAAVLLVLLRKFPLWYRRVLRLGDGIGIAIAMFALFTIVQLLAVMAWRPGPQTIQAAWAQSPQPPRVHKRVVWILFDELSYDQTFGHRAQGLALPNFDALRSESTLYTEMQPIGYKTVKVIPSLFSGTKIDDFRFGFHNQFRVHDTGGHRWQPMTGSDTVFHDAQKDGWRTAIVGWYNPYCTIYANALNSCYWMNLDRLDGDMAQQDSVAANTWRPLEEIGTQLRSPVAAEWESCSFEVRQREQTEADLQKHAMMLLAKNQADLVYLHLPIPHSPNIWSRVDGAYATGCGRSYLDNLALADRVLGQVMAVLKQSPRWKDTTVIVEGDHSWRVKLWDWLPAWTAEDERASREVFDPRPALLIHNAGQTQARTDARAMPLLYVHEAIEDVLQGKTVQ